MQCNVACHMEWNKQIAFNNSNDIYIAFFFGLNTEQTVPARKDAFATFCHLKMDDCDPETLPTSHCGVLSTTLLNHRLISLAKKMIACHVLACNWSCFVCSEYSPATSVAASLKRCSQ